MFVTDQMVRGMEQQYGVPGTARFALDVSGAEYERIRSSQKDGRNHDVTLYINKDDQVAVIAKPFYPPGLYRAPSGGLKPGESFHDGINREISEEVGITINLRRFLLKTSVSFNCDDRSIEWRSFVFTADYESGDFSYTDHEEISEVRMVAWSDFEQYSKIMRQSDIGGLHYRAALHDTVLSLL